VNSDDLVPVLVVVVIALFFGGAIIGARRFAKRRQSEGVWNKDGPIDPSLPPPDFLRVHPQPWGIARPEIESEDDEDEAPEHPHHRPH
jgi:hypothetical protein